MSWTLDSERIQRALRSHRYGRTLALLEQTASTNDEAKAAAKAGVANGYTVVAHQQTSGRGSKGRTWSSPPGAGLYVSVVDRLQVSPEFLPGLTLSVGLAVAKVVESLLTSTRRVEIKWPNDVRIEDRKCAGVLLEGMSSGSRVDAVVLGVGLNLNRTDWPSELVDKATSIGEWLDPPREVDHCDALASLLTTMEQHVDEFVHSGLTRQVEQIESRLAWMGESVRWEDGSGVVVGLASDGGLRVRTRQGAVTLRSATLERSDS